MIIPLSNEQETPDRFVQLSGHHMHCSGGQYHVSNITTKHSDFDSTLGYPGEGPKVKGAAKRKTRKAVRQTQMARNTPSGIRIERTPANQSTSISTSRPKITHTNGGMVIDHTEYYAIVNGGNGADVVDETSLNPGNPVFVWSSDQAKGFTYYRYKRLSMGYVGACSANTVGAVIISFNYDPNAGDQDATTIQGLQNENTQTVGVFKSRTLVIDTKVISAVKQWRNVRSDPVADDLNNYDAGVLTFKMIGNTSATTQIVGYLWVKYSVELLIKRATVANSIPQAVANFVRTTGTTYTATPVAIPIGAEVINSVNAVIGGTTGQQVSVDPRNTYYHEVTGYIAPSAGVTNTIDLECYNEDTAAYEVCASQTINAASGTAIPFTVGAYLGGKGSWSNLYTRVMATAASGTQTLYNMGYRVQQLMKVGSAIGTLFAAPYGAPPLEYIIAVAGRGTHPEGALRCWMRYNKGSPELPRVEREFKSMVARALPHLRRDADRRTKKPKGIRVLKPLGSSSPPGREGSVNQMPYNPPGNPEIAHKTNCVDLDFTDERGEHRCVTYSDEASEPITENAPRVGAFSH